MPFYRGITIVLSKIDYVPISAAPPDRGAVGVDVHLYYLHSLVAAKRLRELPLSVGLSFIPRPNRSDQCRVSMFIKQTDGQKGRLTLDES